MQYKSEELYSKNHIKNKVSLLYYCTGIPTSFINSEGLTVYSLGACNQTSPFASNQHLNLDIVYIEVESGSLLNIPFTHINQFNEYYFTYAYGKNTQINGLMIMGPVKLSSAIIENQLAFMTKYAISISEFTDYIHYKENIPVISPKQIPYFNQLLKLTCLHAFDLSQSPLLAEPMETLLDETLHSEDLSHVPELHSEYLSLFYAFEQQLSQNLFTDHHPTLEVISDALSAYEKPVLAVNDPLRSEKNLFISNVNLYARFAIEAGLNSETSLSYCYYFIQEVEKTFTISEVNQLTTRMITSYKRLVNESNSNTFSNPVNLAKDYIDKHITNHILLRDVAETIGYSSKYLSEVFAKETGITFKAYVNEKKLEVAKSLLLNPKNSLVDICDYLGFCNQSYFSKIFKKSTGSSPSTFIKQHRH